MQLYLFDSALLDRLEGLNERYALLTRRLEALHDEAAAFDRPPNADQLANFGALRRKIRAEVMELLREVLDGLENSRQ